MLSPWCVCSYRMEDFYSSEAYLSLPEEPSQLTVLQYVKVKRAAIAGTTSTGPGAELVKKRGADPVNPCRAGDSMLGVTNTGSVSARGVLHYQGRRVCYPPDFASGNSTHLRTQRPERLRTI